MTKSAIATPGLVLGQVSTVKMEGSWGGGWRRELKQGEIEGSWGGGGGGEEVEAG